MSGIDALYAVADGHEADVLDRLRRRAGLIWEHIGCWTNPASAEACERCGLLRAALEAEQEVLP